MNSTLLILGIIGLPLVASPLVYLLGRVSVRKGGYVGMTLAQFLTLLVLVVEGVLFYLATKVWVSGSFVSTEVGTILVGMDGMALLLGIIATGLGFCVTLFSIPYMDGEDGEEKFYALLLALIGAIIGLGCAADLFNLWVWFEVMAVSSFFLVAFYNEQPASLEAGFKYLTQSAVGSAMVLFGIAILFTLTGSVSMSDVWNVIAGKSTLALVAGGLIIVGFGVKAALVPLHTWLPDAHSQAPSGISAMLSGVVIEAGLVAMLRTLGLLANLENAPWGPILLAFGCINVLVGNLMALRQKEVKRLLAYSSIAQVGYMMIGFGISVISKVYVGAAGGFFHLFTHAMMKGLAFLAAGALLYSLHIARGEHAPLVLEDLNGVSKKYPIIAFLLSLALLGLGGLPPMAGFMSKWQILLGAAQISSGLMIGVIIFVGLNSVLSLAYYAPMINRMYRHEASEAVVSGKEVSWIMVLPMVLLAIGIIAFGIWPSLATFLTNNAAASFIYPFGS
ncbi:MAG: proton-conducting transporter membrane subunit [Anaerolineaceae bacterium]|nr:proton-conducting transporter membrane subunit [Anaerolineaceae bacterium]